MTGSSDIAVIAGGVGAARFLRAIRLHDTALKVTALVNTGDDTVVNGLRVSPDLDTVVYTLAEAIDPERGWGQRDESWTVMQSLRRYSDVRVTGSSAPNDWFNVGDCDLALHLYRTARLSEGAPLSQITAEIARAWNLPFDVLPMSDDRVATRVTLAEDARTADGHEYRRGETVSFQEYFVRMRHAVSISGVEFVGIEHATPIGLDLLDTSRIVVIAPSNPVVSIGPVRALRGVNDVLTRRRNSVIGISPIIGGAALKGPADRMLRELGLEPSALGVARLYADVCGNFVVDRVDADMAPAIEALGMRCIVTDTIMSNDDVARRLAAGVIEAMS